MNHCAAALGDLVYVMGGCNQGIACVSVEAYDVATDAWLPIADMITARAGASASTMNEKIYVMGGCGPYASPCTTVEFYDPKAKKWAAAPSMGTARLYFAAATLGNFVYVTGGKGSGAANSAEALGPQQASEEEEVNPNEK